MMRRTLFGLFVSLALPLSITAQQPQPPVRPVAPVGGQPGVAPRAANPAPAKAPRGFELNDYEQNYLNNLLATWEKASAQVKTFSCPFTLHVYNPAFGPVVREKGPNGQLVSRTLPFSIEHGNLSYQRPDKGMFKIETIERWTPKPVPPGHQGPVQGEYKVDKQAIGQHWVCDGKAVFRYEPKQKLLVEQPIPAHLQGKSIVDGPLPFLFGAEADKLKRRFFMKPLPVKDANGVMNPEIIMISAVPKRMADAVEYQMVEIQLDRKTFVPLNMNVIEPAGSRRTYIFDSKKIKVNNTLDKMWGALFATPRTPFGWKKLVEGPAGTHAAAPEGLPARQ